MSDRRTTPVNDRVVARDLADTYPDRVPVDGTAMQVAMPVADLLARPDGPRDRQVLFGETVQVYETRDGWHFIQTDKDSYVGYVRENDLRAVSPATHWISAPATHLYSEANLKSPERWSLSFGSLITAAGPSGKFLDTPDGFVPVQHVTEIGTLMTDPPNVAQLFLGTPYLWGGNSRFGIDCSGLVQAALTACGIPCPGDSDQQKYNLGTDLPKDTPAQRGDLFFWKGHIAMAVDEHTLIHANGTDMATVYEPIAATIARIDAQGEGPLTGHKRLI